MVVFVGPPSSGYGGGAIIAKELAIGGHHAAVVTPAPNGVEKSVTGARRVVFVPGTEIACVFVIDCLNRRHDAALHQIFTDMRRVSFRKRTPALTPFRGTVSGLIECRAYASENKVLNVEEMPRIVAEFLGNTHSMSFRLTLIREQLTRLDLLCEHQSRKSTNK